MVSNGSICVSRLPQVLLASRWSMQPDSLCPTTSMLLLNLPLAGSIQLRAMFTSPRHRF